MTHIEITLYVEKVTSVVVPKEDVGLIIRNKKYYVCFHHVALVEKDSTAYKITEEEYNRVRAILLHGEEHYERQTGKKAN